MYRSSFRMLFALACAALLLMSGCVMLGGDAANVDNRCTSDDDCHGGACTTVLGVPTCVAKESALDGMLIEVLPTAEASYGANTPFLVPFNDKGLVSQSSSGLVVDHDVRLLQVNVSPIELSINYNYKGCALTSKNTIAAELGFYRDAGLPGLPGYETMALALDGADPAYTVDLPPGSYDVHVVPIAPEGCLDPVPPPTFIRNVDLSLGGKLGLSIDKAPRRISGTIGFPKGQDLTGWTLEVIEPKRGKRVSPSVMLMVEPFSLFANYDLNYYWDWGAESSPLLRLLPPDGVVAPTMLWEIAALSPLDPSAPDIQANLVLIDLDAVGRDLEGFAVDRHGKPVVSTVELTSIELSGNSSSNASFNVLVDTDQEGRFLTKVPPGRYRVYAHPTSDFSKAITTVEWELLDPVAGCFCGRTINIVDKSIVVGRVSLPNGRPLSLGTASIYPAADPTRSYLSTRLLADSTPSLIASSPLNRSGGFALPMDPDFVDLVVVPPASSFFPWLVLPQLDVKANVTGEELFNVGSLAVPNPVVLQGRVLDMNGQAVTSATLRVWLPVKAASKTGDVAISLGETTTGPDGSYVLPIAPSVSEPPTGMSP